MKNRMEIHVRRRDMKDLLALRGKVQIDYDWEREEEMEMDLTVDRHSLLVPGVRVSEG